MKHELGQYFTTNKELKNKVLEFVLNKPEIILEPSVGQGDLVEVILKKNNNIIFDMYEIDTNIKMLEGVPTNVVYGDFIEQNIDKKYKTIIGNPPFVKTRTGNLYIDFIEKCYNLLDTNGELIFIIPSDFFKLTSASKLLNNMLINGTFTHIYHPHKENLFENASIDVVVFRYFKNDSINKEVLYNDNLHYIINNDGFFYSQSVQQFRVDCRPQFPAIIFQTASIYTTNYYLPTASFWAIKDLDTNEYVIDFDPVYTKLSADTTSSYFEVYMNGLQPERYYTILLKTTVGGSTLVFDSNYNFKVING